jgi:hypothetical protein
MSAIHAPEISTPAAQPRWEEDLPRALYLETLETLS